MQYSLPQPGQVVLRRVPDLNLRTRGLVMVSVVLTIVSSVPVVWPRRVTLAKVSCRQVPALGDSKVSVRQPVRIVLELDGVGCPVAANFVCPAGLVLSGEPVDELPEAGRLDFRA